MADEAAFDAFVLARSQALLRTAYLLVQDEVACRELGPVQLKGINKPIEAFEL